MGRIALFLRARSALLGGIHIFTALSITLTACASAMARERPAQATQQADMVLLYNSTETDAGVGFEKAAQLYGVNVAKVDVSSTPVNDALLKDANGAYYLAAFIDGTQAQGLDQNGTQALGNAVNAGGMNLFISNFRVDSSQAVSTLTGGEIDGSVPISATSKNYTITSNSPDVTLQLTGVNVRHATVPQDGQVIISPVASHTKVVATIQDDAGNQDPLFVRYQNGVGSVFVVSNYTDPYLRTSKLADNFYVLHAPNGGYYIQQWFSQVMPLLMFMRFAGGNRAWHSNHQYANFTLDDPKLQTSAFDYAGMLQQTESHNFHFTLAAVPMTIDQQDPSVVSIFKNNPDRMSLVQHGDTHEGYEFYRYVISPTDPYSMYVSSLVTQEQHLVQGRALLNQFSQVSGVPYGHVMVFPYGIAPLDTVSLLKKYNFLATVNSSDVPLDTPRSHEWDTEMYPADMEYDSFPIILRWGTGQDPYAFTFFLGKPVLEFDHTSRFANGIDAYDFFADSINSVYGGKVEWKSLDYIMKHLYLEKINADGSMGVMFFTRDVTVSNDTSQPRVVHLQKVETINVPIDGVTVNGVAANYAVNNSQLTLDMTLAPGESREVVINYDEGGSAGLTPTHFVYMPIVMR